jgi:recombination protein RecR
MRLYARALGRLIEQLERLPGIGPKSAQRLAFHLLRVSRDEAHELANAITDVKERIRDCATCFNFTEEPECPICADPQRDRSQICVVADARDLSAMENTGEYHGVYHVLQGLLSPMDDIGPDDLRVKELVARLQGGEVREVIMAMNPVVEGDATAMYLAGLIKPLGIKVTRIALGLPVGGDLDYADQVTVTRALEGRREM